MKAKPKFSQSEHSWIEKITDGYTSISKGLYNELNLDPENNKKCIPKPKYDQSFTGLCKALKLFHDHIVKKYTLKGENPSIEVYRHARNTLVDDFFAGKALLKCIDSNFVWDLALRNYYHYTYDDKNKSYNLPSRRRH